MVVRIVTAEGLFVGLLSRLLAALLLLPLWGISYVIGVAFVQSPLDFTFSTSGVLLWQEVVVTVSRCQCPAG